MKTQEVRGAGEKELAATREKEPIDTRDREGKETATIDLSDGIPNGGGRFTAGGHPPDEPRPTTTFGWRRARS